MEKQEKKTKVSGVYLVLAALTVLFAVSLVFLHKTAYEGASHGNYTVTTQDKTDEITAPTRVVTLVNVNTATAEELETLTGIGPSLAGDHRLPRRARRFYGGGGPFERQGHRRGEARGIPRGDHIHGGGWQ